MSSFFNAGNYASNTINSIFSSLGTNQSSGVSSMLGDYYAIRNGSYLKMAKKYYAGQSSDSKSVANNVSEKLKESNTTVKPEGASKRNTMTATMQAANTAVNSVGKLMDSNLYQKVDSTDADGNKISSYDRKTILDNLKTFVGDYNALVKSVASSKQSVTVQAGVKMTDQTAVYNRALSRVGISIGEDNTLSLDENAFATADIADVESLFTGSVSFGKNIQMKMLQVYSTESVGQNMSDGLYSAQAVNNVSVGNMFDSLF